MFFKRLFFLLNLGLCFPDLVSYHLPYVDLGLSNFFCGVPFREDEGWYFLQFAQDYSSDKFLDKNGNLLERSSSPSYKSWGGISAISYQADKRLWDGRIGFTFGIPYFFTSKLSKNKLGLKSSGKGLGDLFSSLFLQWDLVERNGRPFFQQNAGFVFSVPTGKWVGSRDNVINPGNNLVFFSPYWGYTFFITPKFTFSGYVYYIFSSKNRATKIHPGQALDLIYNLLYEVKDKLFFGFNGYFIQQLQNDKLRGKTICDSKERVLGSGFGALYTPTEQTYLAFHLYFESLARNRTQGTNFILRWIQLF